MCLSFTTGLVIRISHEEEETPYSLKLPYLLTPPSWVHFTGGLKGNRFMSKIKQLDTEWHTPSSWIWKITLSRTNLQSPWHIAEQFDGEHLFKIWDDAFKEKIGTAVISVVLAHTHTAAISGLLSAALLAVREQLIWWDLPFSQLFHTECRLNGSSPERSVCICV